MIEKILKLLPFLDLKSIFAFLRNYPLWFQFLLMIWFIVGLCFVVYFLRKLSIKKLTELFTALKKTIKIFETSRNWLKLSVILWLVGTPFLLLHFHPKYLEFRQELRSPKFVSDIPDPNGNEICFTVVNPPHNIPIIITDIKLELFSHSKFITTKAVEEPRFDLYADISGVLGDDSSQPIGRIAVNVSTKKSILRSDRTFRLHNDDNASFRLKLHGDKNLSGCKFRIIIDYINNKGEKGQIASDRVYIASKRWGVEPIEHIDVVDYEKFIDDRKETHETKP